MIRWLCFGRFADSTVLPGCRLFLGIPCDDPRRDTRLSTGNSRERWLCFSNPPRRRSCLRHCRNKAYGNRSLAKLALFCDTSLSLECDPP